MEKTSTPYKGLPAFFAADFPFDADISAAVAIVTFTADDLDLTLGFFTCRDAERANANQVAFAGRIRFNNSAATIWAVHDIVFGACRNSKGSRKNSTQASDTKHRKTPLLDLLAR